MCKNPLLIVLKTPLKLDSTSRILLINTEGVQIQKTTAKFVGMAYIRHMMNMIVKLPSSYSE